MSLERPWVLVLLICFLLSWVNIQVLLYIRFKTSLGEEHKQADGAPSFRGLLQYANFSHETPGSLPFLFRRQFTLSEVQALEKDYLSRTKLWPYSGDQQRLKYYAAMIKQAKTSADAERYYRKYLNCFAVFPSYEAVSKVRGMSDPPLSPDKLRYHGVLGLTPDGKKSWGAEEMPPPIEDSSVDEKKELKMGGGFYLRLSDALPLDRDPPDSRDSICLKEKYDVAELDDVSIIVVFYNEPLSTLYRSLHSVLNRTPPELLREIILIDDGSNMTSLLPGNHLDQYVTMLPKTRVIHLGKRMGIVGARLAGARAATAPVLVVLDSHVEVNLGWLEPQLYQLKKSPVSLVFPQIDALEPKWFNWTNVAGIGCWLTFKWAIQEKPSLTGKLSSADPIASPSMAGGLFAVYRDWFWEMGGYDEEFEMWGAENVEMAFRYWMCGGRVECTPCARVYHIYRMGGQGYESPPQSLWKNRLRTARIWMDEYYPIAEAFNHHPGFDIGPVDKMLEFKKQHDCKNFSWFLQEIDPKKGLTDMNAIVTAGEIRNKAYTSYCVDTLALSEPPNPIGLYSCHGEGGTQGFLVLREGQIRLFLDENNCLGPDVHIHSCEDSDMSSFRVVNNTQIRHILTSSSRQKYFSDVDPSIREVCLTAKSDMKLLFIECKDENDEQKWTMQPFSSSAFVPLDFSDAYKKAHNLK